MIIEKIETKYKKFLQILFFLSLISPLIVDRRLFYPYVTGMALYFRLITEALFVLWLIFIFLYPKYRLKLLTADGSDKRTKWQLNYLIAAVLIYLLSLGAATYFSSNPYLSFWGDAERMMGLFGILHFFALFFVGTSIFREKKEWRRLLIAFCAASLAVCLYGILQRFGLTSIKPGASRILATVGNAGILAAYLIFGLFFSAYLALTEQKNNWRWVFGASALVHLIAVIMTGTRGAYLGMAAGFLFGGVIIIFHSLRGSLPKGTAARQAKRAAVLCGETAAGQNKKLRNRIVAAAIALVLVYGGLFLCRNQSWVKNNLYLNRLTAFSLSDVTVKTRIMSWRWGLAGFRDKPILGYGLEQFAIPYNKYFQAEYYNYAAGDTYFDRAHNIVVELLATTGIIGLLSYFLLLSMIFYSIYKVLLVCHSRESGNPGVAAHKMNFHPQYVDSSSRQSLSAESAAAALPFRQSHPAEDSAAFGNYLYFAIFGGLLIAYFIQNLLIFDLLPSMIGFMVLLIVVNSNYILAFGVLAEFPERDSAASEKKGWLADRAALRKLLAIPFVLILFIGLGYSYNNYIVKPYKALKDDIIGQVYLPNDYNKGMEYLKRSLSYHTPLDLDLRSAAANTIFNYYRDNKVDAKNIKNDIDYAISLYKENLKYLPDDLYYNYKIAEIMDFRFAVNLDQNIIPEARKYINKAIALSPGRAELYYISAENYLMAGKMEEAIAEDKKAVSLNDKFGQSYWELAKVCHEAAKYDEAKANLIKAIDLGYRINTDTLISLRALFNIDKGVNNEIEFLELIIKNGTDNYLFYSTLANKYYEAGNKEKAIEYAKKSAELNPEMKDKVEKFIEKMQTGNKQ